MKFESNPLSTRVSRTRFKDEVLKFNSISGKPNIQIQCNLDAAKNNNPEV